MKPSSGSLLLAMTLLLVSGTAALAGSTSALDPYAQVEAPKPKKAAKASRAKVEQAQEETVAKTYVTMPPDEKLAKSKSKKKVKPESETVVSEKASESNDGGMVQGFKDGCGKAVKGAGAGMAAPFKGMAKGAKAAGNGTKKVGAAFGGFFVNGTKAFGEKTAAAAKASKEKIAAIPNPLHHDKREEMPGSPKLRNPSAPPGAPEQVNEMPHARAAKVAHGSRFHMPKIWPHRQPEVPPIASQGGVQ